MTPTATPTAPAEEQACDDLTTTRAPFIEQSMDRGELFIEQPYHLYSEANQASWQNLYRRMQPRWQKYAHPKFLEGVDSLALNDARVPRLEDINEFLEPLSAFKAKAVAGYVPAYLFFDCLRRREFPTTVTIRDLDSLDYLPEPDIFHDVAGHVPMHTDRKFSDVLVRFGEVARSAARRAGQIADLDERVQVVESNIKAMARFFWFTVEFGLMRRPVASDGSASSRDLSSPDLSSPDLSSPDPSAPELCVTGSGLLSSFGEIEHCIESPRVQRYPFQLEWVINQYFEIDKYQPLLFFVDSFDHLFEQVDLLEKWLGEGRLDSVSPGEPAIQEADLRSFLDASVD